MSLIKRTKKNSDEVIELKKKIKELNKEIKYLKQHQIR